MSKREVAFQVAADGTVMPSVPLYGGVKGEHNATLMTVTLASGVYEDGDLVRLSFTTGDGTVLSSELIEDVTVTDSALSLSYALPQVLTLAAGQLCMRVVLSRLDEDGTEVQTFRSGEAVLYFDEASVENGTPFWTGISQMLARTVTAQTAATDAQAAAANAAEKAIGARDSAYMSAKNAQVSASAAQAAQVSAKAAMDKAWEAVDTPGRQGASAYEIAVSQGFEGDEAAWLLSLKGEQGEQGPKGEKGDTGAQGEKGDTGATGADGVSPTIEVTELAYGSLIDITDKNGKKTVRVANGADGVACTHSWNGTALTVTSASGTTSADLKGEKGDKGDPYTLTDEDKAAIASDVLAGMTAEVWIFELADGTTVEKAVPTV